MARKITARKWNGDDAASWAVFVDGVVFDSGLYKREVAHTKAQAARVYAERDARAAAQAPQA